MRLRAINVYSAEEKNAFWVKGISKVFNFVLPLMKCESDKKIVDFIDYLKEKYIKK